MEQLLYSATTHNHGKNHTTDSVRLVEDAVIFIESVIYLDGYKLELVFNDGHKQVVDFEPFLRQASNPQIQAYLDLAKFKQFTLEDGDLFWHDYALCFPIADLYENQLLKQPTYTFSLDISLAHKLLEIAENNQKLPETLVQEWIQEKILAYH